jgi:hypothetical protein
MDLSGSMVRWTEWDHHSGSHYVWWGMCPSPGQKSASHLRGWFLARLCGGQTYSICWPLNTVFPISNTRGLILTLPLLCYCNLQLSNQNRPIGFLFPFAWNTEPLKRNDTEDPRGINGMEPGVQRM